MQEGSFLRQNKIFLIPVLILISTGIVFLSIFSKEEIHLTQNGWYSNFLDQFFSIITHFGDGFVFLGGALILCFVKWKYVLGLIYVAALTGVLIGFSKNVLFEGEPRPVKYFEGKTELRLVEGVDMNHWNSFPSGHTTAAFACWGFLAFIVRKNSFKFGFFLIALLAAYSRIYLSQHFLEDVVAGMALGTSIAWFSWFLMQKNRALRAESSLISKR